jgi:hypothetical protein
VASRNRTKRAYRQQMEPPHVQDYIGSGRIATTGANCHILASNQPAAEKGRILKSALKKGTLTRGVGVWIPWRPSYILPLCLVIVHDTGDGVFNGRLHRFMLPCIVIMMFKY